MLIGYLMGIHTIEKGALQIGYGRFSTREQNIDLQKDALEAAGCEKFFFDVVSGAKTS